MDDCNVYLHYHENYEGECGHAKMSAVGKGESFNKAKVRIGDQTFDKVYAFIYMDTAKATAGDGKVLAEMKGDIQVLNATSDGAEWTNGSETWYIEKVGCGCGG